MKSLHYRAPRYSVLLLFLTLYDYLTLKTGLLTQPFVPCMNYIINAFLADYKMLADCTLNTLKLLFLGYFIGVSLGLVTGIACGYSKRIRYWIDPIIKFLGPIPHIHVDSDHHGHCYLTFRRCGVHHCTQFLGSL